MQTILGAGGIIANELAGALMSYTKKVRLVSRNPKKINATDELFPADLLNPEAILDAVKGSAVVYVTIGFPYSAKVWAETWPHFMKHVIAACKAHKSKLVFFDNIYMYDANHLNGMTEDTPINPPSKKGKVRAHIASMVMKEVQLGNLNALIARCADYYGPGVERNGMLRETVIKNFAVGKKANWLGSDSCKHSFTYTRDAAKATALLGNTPDAYNQIWHLPTAPNPFTGKQWITTIASEMAVAPKYRVASSFMVSVLGWFMPIMKEMREMIYQYDRDYVFDSSKFEKRFNYIPMSYIDGIRELIKTDYPD